MYPEELVAPMRKEAQDIGFTELQSAQEVHDALKNLRGTALVLVNSVCGCAAGMARPGAALALKQASAHPNKLYTVFAGQDQEATQTARQYMGGFPPSSPCMALFDGSEVVAVLQRHDIEGFTAEQVAAKLEMLFEEHCE